MCSAALLILQKKGKGKKRRNLSSLAEIRAKETSTSLLYNIIVDILHFIV